VSSIAFNNVIIEKKMEVSTLYILFAIQAVIDMMEQDWPVECPRFAFFGDDENGRPQGVFDPSKKALAAAGLKDFDPLLEYFYKSLYTDDAAFIFLN
jgi:hypothetical protein